MSALVHSPEWLTTAVRLAPSELAAGEAGQIVVTVDVPVGCHIQSHEPAEPFLIPTSVQFDGTGEVEIGPVVYPNGEAERFDWSPVVLEVYRGTIDVIVPVEVAAGATPTLTTISGRLRYQGCTDTTCLPPAEAPLEVNLAIVGPGAR
jgi:hypothetical protein